MMRRDEPRIEFWLTVMALAAAVIAFLGDLCR